MLNPELDLLLRSMTRVIYVVTDEEDRVVNDIKVALTSGKIPAFVQVYNGALGMLEAEAYLTDLKTRALNADKATKSPIVALENFYKQDPQNQLNFLIVTDPQHYLRNAEFVRRVLNVIHQVRADHKTIKSIIFLGPELVIPPALSTYVHVVRQGTLTDTEIQELLTSLQPKLKNPVPEQAYTWLRGLTTYEVESAISHSVVKTRRDPEMPRRIDEACIQEYKRRRIQSTDLLNLIDTSEMTFDRVGGLDRFKQWARETRYSWTPRGKAYGLKPPKGVLCVGVWGCGKSLSVQCLGSAWGLPVIQLELGKLRASAVGQTESNTYRILSYLEAMAPCIAWVDEAEKSFSGAQSSSYSDAGTTSRALGILSTWHQETKAEVCLALTANSLTTLPVEFTNRISERFFFDLPSEDDRVDILKIHLAQRGHLTEEQIEDFNLRILAKTSEGMVPREMEQAVEAALRKSFVEGKEHLDFEILNEELRTKPRILKTMDDELRRVLDWVGYDPDTDDGLRARYASTRKSVNTLHILEGGAAAASKS